MIKMKAVTLNEYGNVDVLTYTMNAELPQLEDKDVLIEVKATSVNPVDWQIREGYLQESIPYEFPLILGWDAAGVVKMGIHKEYFLEDNLLLFANQQDLRKLLLLQLIHLYLLIEVIQHSLYKLIRPHCHIH